MLVELVMLDKLYPVVKLGSIQDYFDYLEQLAYV